MEPNTPLSGKQEIPPEDRAFYREMVASAAVAAAIVLLV